MNINIILENADEKSKLENKIRELEKDIQYQREQMEQYLADVGRKSYRVSDLEYHLKKMKDAVDDLDVAQSKLKNIDDED